MSIPPSLHAALNIQFREHNITFAALTEEVNEDFRRKWHYRDGKWTEMLIATNDMDLLAAKY